MNHQQATTTSATERYLLDEMTVEEREEFEEHYFSCTECAEDMRAAAQLVDGLRAQPSTKLLNMPATAKTRPRFHLPSWTYGAVAAALAAVVCYQSLVVIPELRERGGSGPTQVAMVLLRPETRGSVRAVTRHAGQPVVLSLDVPLAPSSVMEAVIEDDTGRRAALIPVTLPSGESRASVLLPRDLPPAQYTVILRSNSSEVGRYQFALQPQSHEQVPGAK